MREIAVALQKALLDSHDESKSLDNTEAVARARECLKSIHPGKSGRDIDTMLLAEYLNTYERSRAYLEYDEKLGGHVFKRKKISEYRTSCKFDPDTMED